MVEDAPYRRHLETAKRFKEVRPLLYLWMICWILKDVISTVLSQRLTCNEHRAVLAEAKKNTSLESTGIGAAACSRHGFFIVHATVDFQKGEG